MKGQSLADERSITSFDPRSDKSRATNTRWQKDGQDGGTAVTC